MNLKKLGTVIGVVSALYLCIFLVIQQVYTSLISDQLTSLVQNGVEQIKQTNSPYSAQPAEIITIKTSNLPFVAVLDSEYKVITSNGKQVDINAPQPTLPTSEFEKVKKSGRNNFFLQSGDNPRLYVVVDFVKTDVTEYYVVASKNYSQTENNIKNSATTTIVFYLATVSLTVWYFFSAKPVINTNLKTQIKKK
jgi:hypothetical protein